MSRKGSNLLEYGIEEEADPKAKFDSLISVTVSTIMCLAAKCPLPKSNVETTQLFLSTITDDNGKTPRNVRGFLSLLKDYSGPYDSNIENRFEKPPAEKADHEKEKKSSEETVALCKTPTGHVSGKELISSEGQALVKRNVKSGARKSEKEQSKKGGKTLGSRIMTSKSVISSKA